VTGFYGQIPENAVLPVTEGGFYGQIPENGILPVTGGWLLRADLINRRFARNGGLPFTGKSQETPFCP
jgi:hypothetical protein